MSINWDSDDTYVKINPRQPNAVMASKVAEELTKTFKSHFWLTTSGTSAQTSHEIKWVALSKKAILTSAAAVNAHLQISSNDIWINPLPDFHVGGLGILARSYLSQSSVFDYYKSEQGRWNAINFYNMVCENCATLTAMVPAQVYDLVINKINAPSSLRAIVVGGGALPEPLYFQAKSFGWNLLPSYGLTECASQVATAALLSDEAEFPHLQLLSHVDVKTTPDGTLCIKSPSLLTTYAISNAEGIKFHDPKVDGWFTTEDRGELIGSQLKFLGRKGDFIKIGGESVDLGRLESILDAIKLSKGVSNDAAIIAVPDKRLGHVIHLAAEDKVQDEVYELVKQYQLMVMPFEKIRQIHFVSKIPRSSLNKLLKNELLQQISLSASNSDPSNQT